MKHIIKLDDNLSGIIEIKYKKKGYDRFEGGQIDKGVYIVLKLIKDGNLHKQKVLSYSPYDVFVYCLEYDIKNSDILLQKWNDLFYGYFNGEDIMNLLKGNSEYKNKILKTFVDNVLK